MAKRNRKKSRNKKIIIFGFLGLLIAVVLVVALGGEKDVIVPVQVDNSEARTITQVVSATGKIFPIEELNITPEVTGEIVELPVEEGDVVKKGQLLIRIKPDIYVAQRNRARANLESSKATLKIRKANLEQQKAEYERIKGLYKKGLASDSQLELAKSNFLQSEGAFEAQKSIILQVQESLTEAEENLAKTAIYSPLNATISKLNVELGERVLGSNFTQGTNMMTVADLSQMEAIVEVDENDVILISSQDTSFIEIDAFGERTFKGVVTHIGNSAQTTGLGTQDEVVNFEVKIKLLELDEGIRPGMSCDADIQTETKMGVVSVPIQSVTARMAKKGEGEGEDSSHMPRLDKSGKPQKPSEVVFVVEGSTVKMKEVKTGISDDNFIEISEGLSVDEAVVSGPYRAISKELEDGLQVRITNKKKDKSQAEGEEKAEEIATESK